jgi:serine/threonine protein kinase
MPRAVRYRVLNKIAHGGMAEIFLALQTGVEGFQKPVVLKRILPALAADPSFVGMLVDEAHIASTLNHSNLVQVLDLGKSGDQFFLVLEFVDGWSLEQVRRRAQKLRMKMPLPLALYVVGALCRALAYVHTRKRDNKPLGIVHRDVNPQNVLLSREGEVKLADFGIAKAIGKREKSATGVIKGKFAYMSPEQSIGVDLDARSDLFSVGTLLYILTTGKKPFEGATDLDVLMQVRKAKYEKPSVLIKDFNPDVERFIARAMRPDLSRRWQSAEAMADKIDAILVKLAQPSGAAVLKRWLDNLAARDGVKPPAEALDTNVNGPGPVGTIELGSRDLELHEIPPGFGHEEDPGVRPLNPPGPNGNGRAEPRPANGFAGDAAGARGGAAPERAALPTEVDDSESKSIQIIRPRTVVEKLLSAEEAGAEIIGVGTSSPEQSLYSTLPTLQRELPRNGRSAPEADAKAKAKAKAGGGGEPAAKASAVMSPSMMAAAAATTPMPPRTRSFLERVGRFLRRLIGAVLLLLIALGVGAYFARPYLPARLVKPVTDWLERLPPPVGHGEFNR